MRDKINFNSILSQESALLSKVLYYANILGKKCEDQVEKIEAQEDQILNFESSISEYKAQINDNKYEFQQYDEKIKALESELASQEQFYTK